MLLVTTCWCRKNLPYCNVQCRYPCRYHMSDLFSYLLQQTLLFNFLFITLWSFNRIQQTTSENYSSHSTRRSTAVIRWEVTLQTTLEITTSQGGWKEGKMHIPYNKKVVGVRVHCTRTGESPKQHGEDQGQEAGQIQGGRWGVQLNPINWKK